MRPSFISYIEKVELNLQASEMQLHWAQTQGHEKQLRRAFGPEREEV